MVWVGLDANLLGELCGSGNPLNDSGIILRRDTAQGTNDRLSDPAQRFWSTMDPPDPGVAERSSRATSSDGITTWKKVHPILEEPRSGPKGP
jgi:hypothetical protein